MPPFGYQIDYMTFGGIYREVALRVVPEIYLDNIFARPLNVLTAARSLEVDCFLAGKPTVSTDRLSLEVELKDGDRTIARGTRTLEAPATADDSAAALDPPTSAPVHASSQTTTDPARHTVPVTGLADIQLWDLDHPHLYTVHVRLLREGKLLDEDTRRIGFREAVFTDRKASKLNGKVVKLHGLDRHQTFPWVGQAMAARGQRQDVTVLRRKNLRCNMVRTSHYPQSRHFLDACDEHGTARAGRDSRLAAHRRRRPGRTSSPSTTSRRMVRRDWNHPSIVLWGCRINESRGQP